MILGELIERIIYWFLKFTEVLLLLNEMIGGRRLGVYEASIVEGHVFSLVLREGMVLPLKLYLLF